MKRILTAWLLLAAAAPALSGCVAVMAAAVEKAYEDRSTAAQLTDAKIHARILAYLTGISADLLADVNTDIWLGRVLLTGTLDDAGTLAAIAAMRADTGLLIDPHSAVGVEVGRARHRDRLRDGRRDASQPLVALATAHPAKFPDAVEKATGIRPELPARFGDLLTRPERVTELPNDPAAVKAHIRARVSVAA